MVADGVVTLKTDAADLADFFAAAKLLDWVENRNTKRKAVVINRRHIICTVRYKTEQDLEFVSIEWRMLFLFGSKIECNSTL